MIIGCINLIASAFPMIAIDSVYRKQLSTYYTGNSLEFDCNMVTYLISSLYQ